MAEKNQERLSPTQIRFLEDTLASHQEAYFLYEAFQSRRNTFNLFAGKMKELEAQKKLITSSQMIQKSILHMHCNRFLGRDLKREKKRRVFTLSPLSKKLYNEI